MKSKIIIPLFILILISLNISVAQKTKEVRKTFDLNSDGKVYLDTYKGSITINTWDKAQVDIAATIEPDGHSRRDEEGVQETEIRIDNSPDILRIESDYDRLKEHHSHSFWGIFGDGNLTLPFVHYNITMPRTARLEIKDYKSESRIANLHAPFRMETYKGTVTVDGLEGSIRFETYKGEAKFDIEKFTGGSNIETEKGRIDITLGPKAGCDLNIDLGRRADFRSDFDATVRNKHHDETHFTGSINGGGSSLRIESEKGDIRLRRR